MKKILSLILLALLPLVANAEVVEIDGIYYNLVSKIKEAEVTSNPNGYSGAVNIPASVTYEGKEFSVISIGDYAFRDCSGLTSVTIPNSVTSIGDGAFSYCRDLTSITISGSVTSIGDEAFKNCSGLKKVIVPDIAAWCGISFNGYNANPLSQARHLYSNETTEITKLIIPNNVTSIGDYAFYYCVGLTSVIIGSGVTSIGEKAFQYCSGLTSVTIGNSVTSIGEYTFDCCSSLTSVTIGNSVTSIGNYAFQYCTSLTSVIIPNSLTSIDAFVFANCSSLTSVTIPNSVTNIGPCAFENSGLTSIDIPNSVTSIGVGVFQYCSSLTSVHIPGSLTSIGENAFFYCTCLTSVTIGNGVTSIGYNAFEGCSSLTSVNIPNSVTSIGQAAFSGCSGLTSVTIPNSVTTIEGGAFSYCSSLTSISIGNGIKVIDGGAFFNCPELADVYCYAEEVPETGSGAFEGSYIEYATLYVPESAIEQYRATEPWRQFGTIKTTDGNIPDPPKPEICATPTISYANGELIFNCETEGVEYISEITDTDIKKYYEKSVSLSATYTITVYAMKDGYENSEVATGTLCWIDVAPETEGIVNEDAVTEVKAMPVLIQSQGGTISIQGAAEGTPIAVYDIEGKQYGSTIAEKDRATITTSLRPGSVAVVKIGEKSVKVAIK